MKFAIGYQNIKGRDSFPKIVEDYRENIEEVYFAWPGTPSGRHILEQEIAPILENDLCEIRKMGIRLDILFNANCYGEIANSKLQDNNVLSIMKHIQSICGLPDVVTTTSPAIAYVIKKNFPDTEIRASVNMIIGMIQGMQYASALFDGFCVQRDLQRNIQYMRKIKNWCLENKKKLIILANSGCLKFCPGQIFHDNAVAHNAETGGKYGNIANWNPFFCWKTYSDKSKISEFLKSTWIRPEDIKLYEGIADIIKLATRQHSHPRTVIDAYVSAKFDGNLLNLTEPCFAELIAPQYIDNSAFPKDWGLRISQCKNQCNECNYCEEVIRVVLKNYFE